LHLLDAVPILLHDHALQDLVYEERAAEPVLQEGSNVAPELHPAVSPAGHERDQRESIESPPCFAEYVFDDLPFVELIEVPETQSPGCVEIREFLESPLLAADVLP